MPKPTGFVFAGTDKEVMLAIEALMPVAWEQIPSTVDAVVAMKVLIRAFLLDGARHTGKSVSWLEEKLNERALSVTVELDDTVQSMPVTKYKLDGN